jgi:hypothetical protein
MKFEMRILDRKTCPADGSTEGPGLNNCTGISKERAMGMFILSLSVSFAMSGTIQYASVSFSAGVL